MSNQIANYKYKHKKVNMADTIPLDTPFIIVIEPTNACNFKYSFCFHSLLKEDLAQNGFTQNTLSLGQFQKIIQGQTSFPKIIKMLRFSGFGETLLNKKLSKMIEFTKEIDIAEQIMVISNGSLLTTELSDSLIDAGLDELLISVEGLSGKINRKLCSVDIDFENFITNINYFYNNIKECKLYARILTDDRREADYKLFDETFGNIVDTIFIDKIIPLFAGVDYSTFAGDILKDIERNPKKSLDICVQPFNSLFIHASGNVSACCTDYLERILFVMCLKNHYIIFGMGNI